MSEAAATLVCPKCQGAMRAYERNGDELYLPSSLGALPVRDHPDVGRDAGVVEELVRKGDDRIEPVVLDDPSLDLRLARAGRASEQGASR